MDWNHGLAFVLYTPWLAMDFGACDYRVMGYAGSNGRAEKVLVTGSWVYVGFTLRESEGPGRVGLPEHAARIEGPCNPIPAFRRGIVAISIHRKSNSITRNETRHVGRNFGVKQMTYAGC